MPPSVSLNRCQYAALATALQMHEAHIDKSDYADVMKDYHQSLFDNNLSTGGRDVTWQRRLRDLSKKFEVVSDSEFPKLIDRSVQKLVVPFEEWDSIVEDAIIEISGCEGASQFSRTRLQNAVQSIVEVKYSTKAGNFGIPVKFINEKLNHQEFHEKALAGEGSEQGIHVHFFFSVPVSVANVARTSILLHIQGALLVVNDEINTPCLTPLQTSKFRTATYSI